MRLHKVILTSIILAGLFPMLSFAANSSSIRGQIRNQDTGNFIEGGLVSIVGTNRSTVTDSQGQYNFGSLSAGTYKLRVESAGSSVKEVTAIVSEDGIININVALDSEIYALEKIMVTAQAEGQAQALNLQKNSENIRKVASQDALANSRLGEVGEVLQSLPGLYLEISTHQPSRANIRGLGSEFNSVTFDGVRIGNTNNDRADNISGYPAESLSRVELMKSVTPDMEGDSIGGSINLVSRRAFDFSERLLRVNVGGAFNNQQKNWDKQINIEYADRYSNGRLGVYSSINHYRSDRGYHTSSISYQVDNNDNYNISTYTLQDRIEDDSWKLKYTGSVDYKLSDNTVLWFRGLYSNDTRSLEDYRITFRPGTRTNITPDSADAASGRIDTDRQYREPVSIAYQFASGLESKFGSWSIDSKFSFNRASNEYSETFTPTFSFNGVVMSYDRSEREFPVFLVKNGVDVTNPALLSNRSIARSQHPSTDDTMTFDFNAQRDLDHLPFKAYLKTGLRAKIRDWTYGGDTSLGNWSYTGPLSAGDLSEYYSNPRFFRESNGRSNFTSVFPNISKFLDAFYNRPSEFTRADNASDILIESNRKSTKENIYATYLMGGATFGKLNLVTGARVEYTEFEGTARQLNTPNGVLIDSIEVKNSASYANVLPGVHLNYSATPNLILRFSVNRTIARPSPTQMLPNRRVDDDAFTVNDGNPDLDVTSATNMDFSAEYYLKPLGVISVGLFNKDIDGFYFNSASTIQSGEYAGYRLTRTEMGQGGQVKGLELEWQQRLTFLPGIFSGLGLGANYTWLDASGYYPTRPSDQLTFIGTAKTTGNFNVSFVHRGLDLRLFYNVRGDYLSAVGARAALDVYEQERATLDFSAKYKFSPKLTGYVNVKNITDAPKLTYMGNRSNPTAVRYYDFSVNFGVSREF